MSYMHATIGAASWFGYTFGNTSSIKLGLHNYVRPVYILSFSIYTYTYIQAAMLNKTGDFHCFTVHFSSLCVMVQLTHLYLIKH
jgi:hypothetical protein